MLESPETTPSICCTQCSHQAVWPFQFDHHIQRNHRYANQLFHAVIEPEQYTCVYCSSNSYYKLGGFVHFKNKHAAARRDNKDNIESDQITDDFGPYPSQCNYCKYKCYSIVSIVKHHDLCKVADSTYLEMEFINVPNEFDLTNGLQCSSKTKRYRVTAGKNKKWFKCTECSFRARRKHDLKRHALCKHASRKKTPWLMADNPQCSFRAKEKKVFKMNNIWIRITADDEKWFNCPTCSYRAKRKSNLKTHMLTHATDDEVKWFTCTMCSFQAKYKSSLKSHMLTHATADQINWFTCNECSFRAKRKSSLKTHMMTHATADQIKWYCCTECSFRAKYNSNLKSHMLNHATSDDIKWFNCTECSYKAKRRRTLNTHMLTHAVAN